MNIDRVRELTRLSPAAGAELTSAQLNTIRNAWEFATGAEVLSTTPPSVQLARNNTCNFKCVYCPDHRVGNAVPRIQLNEDVWGNLLPLVDGAMAASFHGISEFFLDKDFFTILQRCAAAGGIISLNTNGSVCTEKHLEALSKYPGGIAINFSVDAATPETYRRIRGWDFERVMGNIRRYLESFEQRRGRTYVSFSYVVCKSNVHEMVLILELAHSLGVDCVKFYPLLDSAGLDWEIATKDAGTFNYRAEMSDRFEDEFNRQIEASRQMAERLGIDVELPETVTVAEPTPSSLPIVEEISARHEMP